jgi:hypothetical protein
MAFWYVGEEEPHSNIIWSIGICFCSIKKRLTPQFEYFILSMSMNLKQFNMYFVFFLPFFLGWNITKRQHFLNFGKTSPKRISKTSHQIWSINYYYYIVTSLSRSYTFNGLIPNFCQLNLNLYGGVNHQRFFYRKKFHQISTLKIWFQPKQKINFHEKNAPNFTKFQRKEISICQNFK